MEVLHAADVQALRRLCREDLFFLLTIGFNRADINRDWLYARCRDVEATPDGMLDLWAREHYKSTLITYGKSIQDILNNPEVTIGIFSHKRPIAKDFLDQIKRELEVNEDLKGWFPDILYRNPQKESPRWSLDGGIVVKRKTNPKEATVEAHGLVDGQPTGKHFSLLVYDDVVTRESVTTPDMIKKVTDAWALSLNLGAHGGRRRYIGTRYHFNDTYREIMARQAAKTRLFPATDDGTPHGEPVFLSKESLDEKRREMGPYIFGCQMLQNPIADEAQGFHEDWIEYYDRDTMIKKGWPKNWNYYLLCDPAGAKKKENDFTVMWVIALGDDSNYYLVDGVRDRLNLTERTAAMIRLHKRYNPKRTGYERYGKDSDIEHIQYEMAEQNYRFRIIELGGSTPKEDRIRKLVPIFEQHRFYLPYRLMMTDYQGKSHDLVEEFKNEEYNSFPVSVHDDMLDCMARITHEDFGAIFPRVIDRSAKAETAQVNYGDYSPLNM